MQNEDFYVTVKEAFEWGRLIGQKEAFQEIIELLMNDDVSSKKYAQYRLQVLETASDIIRAQQGE